MSAQAHAAAYTGLAGWYGCREAARWRRRTYGPGRAYVRTCGSGGYPAGVVPVTQRPWWGSTPPPRIRLYTDS
jgi:hypothetical protein